MADTLDLPVRSYRDLRVWQASRALVVEIYTLTRPFPQEERYGLTAQMRRAAISVPSNIAEGNARSSKEYIRFLEIALGSLAELETQLEIAGALGYIQHTRLQDMLKQTDHVGRMLRKLSQSIQSRIPGP